MILEVLSEGVDFSFLGQKDSKLITQSTVDKGNFLFCKVPVNFFGEVDVQLPELTPNVELVVFRDGS